MSMSLYDARIGYAGYSHDFRVPGDRRRFSAYARQKDLRYEPASLERDYDLVLLTHHGDLPGWTRRKRRQRDAFKLVFELIDSYFVQTALVRRWLKGIARYALGTDSRLSVDFLRVLEETCRTADAVICSTPEQQGIIARFNANTFLSFDYFRDELGTPKNDFRKGERLRLVWEGQAHTLGNLNVLREPLNDLRDQVELHVVTDPVGYRYLGRFGAVPSLPILRGIECPKYFHRWEMSSFSARITEADIAIIPIDSGNPMMLGKPENKLVLLWQLGMPVLVSPTPAYARAMAAAEIDGVCHDLAGWGAALERMIAAPEKSLQAIGEKGRRHALAAYSMAEFQARFDAALAGCGFTVEPPRPGSIFRA
ncbi:MAG: glycosyltransferase [Sphingosinicella sp.]